MDEQKKMSNIELKDIIGDEQKDIPNVEINNTDKAEEEEQEFGGYVKMINVFMKYYVKYNKNAEKNFFAGVNYNDLKSTNRPMEIFFEHMQIYKENGQQNYFLNKIMKMSEENIGDIIYELYIDNVEPVKSHSLFSLLLYIVENDLSEKNFTIATGYKSNS